MVLGEIYPEIGFITQSALSNGGVESENTGSDPLVLTFDFPQNAHSQIPGVSKNQTFVDSLAYFSLGVGMIYCFCGNSRVDKQ